MLVAGMVLVLVLVADVVVKGVVDSTISISAQFLHMITECNICEIQYERSSDTNNPNHVI